MREHERGTGEGGTSNFGISINLPSVKMTGEEHCMEY